MMGNITERNKQTLCINIMCSLIKDQISTYEASWSKISNLNPIKLLDPPINLQEKIKDRNTLNYTMRMKSQKKIIIIQRFQLLQEINYKRKKERVMAGEIYKLKKA